MQVILGVLLLLFSMAATAAGNNLFSDTPEQQARMLHAQTATPVTRFRQAEAFTSRLINQPQWKINLFTDHNYLVQRKTANYNRRGALVWNGEVKSRSVNARHYPASGSATLIIIDGKITGTVRAEGKLFSIRPNQDGSHTIQELNEQQFPPEHPDGFDVSAVQQAITQSIPVQQADAVGVNTLRVLVVYTPAVAAAVADVPGLIDLAIAETTNSYANSAVDDAIQIELAGSALINYVENTEFSSALDQITNRSDGIMDEVHQMRLDYQADVVVLLVDQPDYCGVAFLNAAYEYAFAVVYYSCATGYYSFAHEIGHLHGALHDIATSPGSYPFAYGHGYQSPAETFRTIMAYDCPGGCPRIPHWSSPDILYAGEVTGIAEESDNARVLRETAGRLANLYESYSAVPLGTELWFYNVNDRVYATPALSDDGRIFFGSRNGTFYALNPDGTLNWSYATPVGITGSALLHNGSVYFQTYGSGASRYLYALNQADGALQWTFPTSNSATTPAVADDGTLYLDVGNSLVAINPDGTQRWSINLGGPMYASPSISADGNIYVGTSVSPRIVAISPAGQQLWSFNADSNVRSNVAISNNGILYVSTQNGVLYALNTSGELQWTYTMAGSNFTSSPVIDVDGNILIGDGTGRLYWITESGELLRTVQLNGTVGSTPAIANNGTIYVTSGGRLHALNAQGDEMWFAPINGTGQSSVMIAPDGTLYVGDSATSNGGIGGMRAFEGGEIQAANSAWPMNHHDLQHSGHYRMPNQAPTLTINTPVDGSVIAQGTSLVLNASAMDNEDGDLSSSVIWNSSIDGVITSPSVLSLGTHVLTASVTDSGGLNAIAVTSVNVLAVNADDDADGMPNGWEIAHNLNPNNPDDAQENPDGDGMNNLREYLNGSNPQVSDVVLGDINNDGTINVVDLLFMRQQIIGLIDLDSASVNRGDLYPPITGDGQITISDVILLHRAMNSN